MGGRRDRTRQVVFNQDIFFKNCLRKLSCYAGQAALEDLRPDMGKASVLSWQSAKSVQGGSHRLTCSIAGYQLCWRRIRCWANWSATSSSCPLASCDNLLCIRCTEIALLSSKLSAIDCPFVCQSRLLLQSATCCSAMALLPVARPLLNRPSCNLQVDLESSLRHSKLEASDPARLRRMHVVRAVREACLQILRKSATSACHALGATKGASNHTAH